MPLSRFVLLCFTAASMSKFFLVSAMPQGPKDTMRAGLGFKPDVSTPPVTTVKFASDLTTTLVEGLTEKSTRKPYNCSESHRPHMNDSNKFQVRHNNVWWDQVCQGGLVWNQTLCRCDYPSPEEGSALMVECPEYREHRNASWKYEQRVNGVWQARDCSLAVLGLVWNQTACRCDWGPEGDTRVLNVHRNTPCDTMLNVTFDNGLVDEAKSSFLELTSGSTLALRHFKTSTGDVNKAAYLRDTALTVWYFAGNEMSGSLRVEFRFLAEDVPSTRERYQILLSNGCNVTGLGYTTPSLAIGYRAMDTSFLVALHTTAVRKAIVCTRDMEPYAWHHVSLIYEDGTLLFRVNSHPCIISDEFSGDVEKTSCPLTIGADPLEKESKYIGYMDDLMVARHCRRFVEQSLLPGENNNETNDDDDDNVNNEDTSSDNRRVQQPRPSQDKSVGDILDNNGPKDKNVQPYRAMGALL